MSDILNEIRKLKLQYAYKRARELIESTDVKSPDLLRALAECYYKDLELHRSESFPIAIKILENMDLSKDDNPSETLCLLGAIYKRKWENEKNLDNLYDAIKNYEKAYTKYKNSEWYYGAINTSFLYDVLANEFKEQDHVYAQNLQSKAIEIRENIIKEYDCDLTDRKDILWIKHTLAQAYLGIDDIENCKKKLKEANEIKSDDWENHTSYKHLNILADLKNTEDRSFLNILLSNDFCASLDKKGLALSGGGFRASFFHLGTLAKLAECNLLKDIEVISTVSGGSIVGVLYYLKLQQLLEGKKDCEITQEDYIKLVDELINEFFEAVQTNIRNSVFYSNPLKTLKYLIPFSGYSRTNRLGELYQKRIYRKYKKYMKDLLIIPHDWKDKNSPFRPRFNNWSRKNKVPILVINATNLNSGHNWQFQATKMGEPDYMSHMEIDKNDRFEWIRYSEENLKNEFKNYQIGQAVASSSAVPVLFTPIVIKDLYQGYKLSISDGGVYDNQGFSGLLSEECDFIICSDAAKQMDNKKSSSTNAWGVNLRSIDIEMDRNRELVFEDMKKKDERGILKDFFFTHLKHDFTSHVVKQEGLGKISLSYYDKFQKSISEIRTDLDRFSLTEANALMYNGYLLFEKEYSKNQCEQKHMWSFLEIKKDIENESEKLLNDLEFAKKRFFRGLKKWWSNPCV